MFFPVELQAPTRYYLLMRPWYMGFWVAIVLRSTHRQVLVVRVFRLLSLDYLSVLAGDAENVVCAGSERFSIWMLAKYFKEEAHKIAQLKVMGLSLLRKIFCVLCYPMVQVLPYYKANPTTDGFVTSDRLG